MKSSATRLNDPKTIRAWSFFDWANSAFALVITTAVFPPYFLAMVDDHVSIGGVTLTDSTILSWSISIAYIVVAMKMPFWSGIADYAKKRKLFLIIFTILGALSCLGLYFFSSSEMVWMASFMYMLGIAGFEGGKLFYDSFLPLIATKDRYDMVSAKGFSYGYIGSVILLLINLVWIQMPERFGFADSGAASRAAFLSVGIWWIVFAMIPFRRLPADDEGFFRWDFMKKSWNEIRKAWRIIASDRNALRFLGSYFLYISGTITVIYLATTFATKELNFEQTELIITVLIIQLVAIAGAYLFGKIATNRGSIYSLQIMLIIWAAICLAAYFITSKEPFYLIAGSVGLVMGGIQSTSRAAYAKIIGDHQEEVSSLFSFYEVLEKLAVVFGSFLFGLVGLLSGSLRLSVLLLCLFFVVSYFLLRRVKID